MKLGKYFGCSEQKRDSVTTRKRYSELNYGKLERRKCVESYMMR
jgi:hypothetical protein